MSLLVVSARRLGGRLLGRTGRRLAWLVVTTVVFATLFHHFDVPASNWAPSMVASFVIPLAALGSVRATVGRAGLTNETARLATFGASPWRAVGALAALAVGTSALIAASTATLAFSLGHTYADPSRAVDVPITFAIAAAAGGAFACVFLWTHTFAPFFRSFFDTAVLLTGGFAIAFRQSPAFALLRGHLEKPWRPALALAVLGCVFLAFALFRTRPRKLRLTNGFGGLA